LGEKKIKIIINHVYMQTKPFHYQPESLEAPKVKLFLTFASIVLGLLISFLIYEISYLKSIFIILGCLTIILFFRYPELGLVMSFSSGIFKEWLSTHVSVFAQFDFTVIVFGLSLLSVILVLIRKGTLFDIPIHSSFIPFMAFTGMLFISTLYTPSPEYGNMKAFSFLFFNWALFLFPILVIREEKTCWRIIFLLVALGGVVSLSTIFTLLKGISQQNLLLSYRASFLGINSISYGGWVGMIAILLISVLPRINKRIQRITAILMILLLTVALLVSNSRGPLLSFILTLLVILIVRFRSIPKKKLAFLFGIFIILIIVTFTLLPAQLTSRYTDIFQNRQSQNYLTYYTVNARLHAWITSLQIASENLITFIFGVGSGGFSNKIYFQDIRLYPHNIFLEVLCELGLIGLVLIVWHFLSILLDGIRTLSGRTTDEQKVLLFAFLMMTIFGLISAQFSGDLNDNRRLWFYLGLLVAIMTVSKRHRSMGKN